MPPQLDWQLNGQEITLIVIGVIVAIYLLLKAWNGFRKWFIRVWDRYKKKFSRWRERSRSYILQLRYDLRFLTRPLSRAIVYILCLLPLAAFAPKLFLFFVKEIGNSVSDIYKEEIASAFVAIVAGIVPTAITSSLRGHRIALVEKVLDALTGAIAPDRGFTTAIVDFYPKSRHWADGTFSKHQQIECAPERAPEWVVAVYLAGGSYKGSYDLNFLKSQIEALERKRNEIKNERHACDISGDPIVPVMNWVCFVSSKGRFHAMQKYEEFRHQIIVKENSAYLHMLNASNEDALWREITQHLEHSKPKTGNQKPECCTDTISGLDTFWIEQGTSRETALKMLARAGRSRAMVVRKCTSGAPLGVVTVDKLLQDILYLPLERVGIATPDAGGHYDHTKPPFFTPSAPTPP